MSVIDQSYYLRRYHEETEAARLAKSDEARERHQQLADAYRERCGHEGSTKLRLMRSCPNLADYAA